MFKYAPVILSFLLGTAAADIPTAKELIDKYSQALDSTSSFIEHYKKKWTYGGRFPRSHPFYATYGRKRFNYDCFERGVFKFKENEGSYHQEYRWGYFNEDKKNIPPDKPTSRLWITSGTLNYFHQVNRFRRQTDLAKRRDAKRTVTISPPDCIVGISHILGYVDTEERLDEVLRKADHVSVRRRTEKVGDVECFRIEADTKYGRFAIWIDPEHGYHAARVRHKAQEGQYLHTQKVSAGSIGTGYSEVLQFKQVDNIWVPVEIKAGFHRTIGSPEYYMDEDAHYKRIEIILNPDHDKLGSFDDPLENPANDPELKNGTRVRLNKESYIWQDGQLVPKEKVQPEKSKK